ncbi:sensor histidine kinase [Nocardiopsis ganjiahuensis]|uniref:sensor histidine kinase n=1 Tax=Nocardiopsis ganjiahuensis TaxID=239984 RepID=UPI000347874B|nr:histidine kinase [Nocardiopsis ganjiahuensis]
MSEESAAPDPYRGTQPEMGREPPPPRTPLEALRRLPHRRFLLSSWPWRSLLHLASTAAVGAVLAGLIVPITFPLLVLADAVEEIARGHSRPDWFLAALLGSGLALLLALGPLVAVPVAALERWRLRLVHPRLTSGHRPTGRGVLRWARIRYTEAATWREFAYLLLLIVVVDVLSWTVLYWFAGVGPFLIATPVITALGETVAVFPWEFDTPLSTLPLAALGTLLLLLTPYAAALAAHANAALARVLLDDRGTEELRSELVEVTRSRARLVDAFEAERRRIERDLHDGAQQQLISLAMQVGLARMDAPPGSEMERTLASVHGQAKEIIGSLREIVHGIHPKVLSDRGLPAALPELADRSAVPVRTHVNLPGRLPAHVENTAYYVAAESLSNVTKHAGATEVRLNAVLDGDTLVLETTDDGRGGADPGGGTGLTGLADRVAVVGGRIWLSSPPGGPTRLRAEIPCLPSG